MQDPKDIPAAGMLGFNLMGVLFNVVFGTIDGWSGGALFHTDHRVAPMTVQA